MDVQILENSDSTIVLLIGRLDTAASAEVEQNLKPLHEKSKQNIVFDCQQLQYISSSGLRILLGVLKYAKPSGCRVVIKNLSTELKNVFAMTGFDKLFEFID